MKIHNKTLVIYYSLTGNIELFVNRLREIITFDACRLEPVTPYPTDGKEFLTRYHNEMNNRLLPEYKTIDININEYNTIVIAAPNWSNTIPPIMRTFLTNNKFTNKIIIPIVSQGGSKEDRLVSEIQEYTKGNNNKDSLVFRQCEITDSEIKDFINKVL